MNQCSIRDQYVIAWLVVVLLRDVSCVLEVREDVVDGVKGIVEVFCCAAAAEEVIAVGVFDEKIGVYDVVAEFGDLMEASVGGAVGGEAAGMPAGFDAGDDGFEGRELCVVDLIESDVGGLRIFISVFDIVEFVWRDGRVLPVRLFVED